MRYHIERGVAYLIYGGDWGAADAVDLHRRLSMDPAFRPDMPKVIRIESMTSALSVDEMINTGATIKSFYAGSKAIRRTAYVSPDPEVARVVKLWTDLYQLGSDDSHVDIRFFTDLAEAEVWARVASERKVG